MVVRGVQVRKEMPKRVDSGLGSSAFVSRAGGTPSTPSYFLRKNASAEASWDKDRAGKPDTTV
jgi:hypothetical protein